MTSAQVSQQHELRIIADAIVRSTDFDTGLSQLSDQLLDRHLEHLGELGNRYISHIRFLWGLLNRGLARTNAREPS